MTTVATTTPRVEPANIQVFRVYINAPAERIWQAISSGELSGKYGYGGTIEADLQAGGDYRHKASAQMLQMGLPAVVVTGQVIESDPPHRLVHMWNPIWNDDPDTRLTWEITTGSNGLSCVTLTHELLGAVATAAEVAGGGDPENGGGGWPWVLSSLKTYLETGDVMPGSGG
ncbi:MAG: SRPBCC domain-containing protein [Antricoccus sp.]